MSVPEEERRLILACVEGDANAWNAFVERYSPFLFASIRKTLARRKGFFTPDEAESLYQDVFWELYRNDRRALASFDGRSKLTTYLWVIAYRKVIDHLRGEDSPASDASHLDDVPDPPAPGESPLERLQTEERRASVRQALQDLPEKDRDVLLAFYFEGRSHREIARKTGLTPEAVNMAVFRGRKKLERILKKTGKKPL